MFANTLLVINFFKILSEKNKTEQCEEPHKDLRSFET